MPTIINGSDEQYYTDPDKWGEGKFITLENVIDNILLTSDDDSYFKHSKRFRASIFGKQIMKRLKIDLKNERKAIAIQLSPSKTFPYPRYMDKWHKVYVMNKCDKLTVLNVNLNTGIDDYLQDHEWKLMYDENGNILEGAEINSHVGECYEYKCVSIQDACTDDKFKDSWVKDIKDGAYFEFSDELVDEVVVIEFTAANLESLDDCDIKIPHVLELTVENWIRCHLLKSKRNVPENQWKMYWEFYKLEKKRAKHYLATPISINEILKSVSLRYK